MQITPYSSDTNTRRFLGRAAAERFAYFLLAADGLPDDVRQLSIVDLGGDEFGIAVYRELPRTGGMTSRSGFLVEG